MQKWTISFVTRDGTQANSSPLFLTLRQLALTATSKIVLPIGLTVFLCAGAARADWQATTRHAATWHNVKDFGAKGDGKTDDTSAIQAAIDKDRSVKANKTPATIYVPSGTYKISDTLILWNGTQIRGDEDRAPTFVLASESKGFSDPSQKKPLLVATNGYKVDPATRKWQVHGNDVGGSSNNTFYTQIHNLNISIKDGNPGAVGIFWRVAQETSLRNVNITSSDAAIGIDVGGGQSDYAGGYTPDQGGGGTIEDISIEGGVIGMRISNASQWTFRSLNIRNQTSVSVSVIGYYVLSFIDLNVSGAPRGVSYSSGQNMLTILDSNLQGTGQAFSGDGSPYYAENTIGITSSDGAEFGAPAALKAFADGAPVAPGAVPLTRGTRMMLRPRPKIRLGNSCIANAHDLGAKGDGTSDDTAMLESAINKCDTVYLPEGNYLISDTLVLRPSSRIFGEGVTKITLASKAAGFSEPSSPKPMILAPDAASAQTVLANLSLYPGDTGNPGAIPVKWGTGGASGMWDVAVVTYSAPDAADLQLFGHGGGVFSDVYLAGTNSSLAGFLGNSTGPAWFYGLESEHMTSDAYRIVQASDYYFVTPETELSPTAFDIENSSRIWIYGFIGAMWGKEQTQLVKFSGSSDLSFAGIYLFNLQDICITMPVSGNSCQLAQGGPDWSRFALLRFSKPPIVAPDPAKK